MKKRCCWGAVFSLLLLSGYYSEAKEPAGTRLLTFEQALDLTDQNSHTLKQAGYLQTTSTTLVPLWIGSNQIGAAPAYLTAQTGTMCGTITCELLCW